MNYEKCCGFVVYRIVDDVREYLIQKSVLGNIGFPKGHVEGNETEYETAIRELKEETNLEVEIQEGFRTCIEYMVPRKEDTLKQVVFFLGKMTSGELRFQEKEISSGKFMNYEEAMQTLTHDDVKSVLKAAEDFLSANNK